MQFPFQDEGAIVQELILFEITHNPSAVLDQMVGRSSRRRLKRCARSHPSFLNVALPCHIRMKTI
jgi:hypothetical protein